MTGAGYRQIGQRASARAEYPLRQPLFRPGGLSDGWPFEWDGDRHEPAVESEDEWL